MARTWVIHLTKSAHRPSLYRLIAEGLVIVLSILLAFGIDAWWDSSREREREHAYLRQLANDLEGTLENNAFFGARADSTDQVVARLARAYYAAQPPPVDSLEKWWDEIGYWVVQPRLGTVQALVTTGDLTLIRNDSLRASLPSYLANVTAFEGFEAEGERRFGEAARALSSYVDRVLVRVRGMSDAARDSIARSNPLAPIPTGPLRDLPRTDLMGAVQNPSVHQLLNEMRSAQRTMRRYRQLMRRETEELLAQVRAAQARSSGAP